MFQIRHTPIKNIATAEYIGVLTAKVARLKRERAAQNSEGDEIEEGMSLMCQA